MGGARVSLKGIGCADLAVIASCWTSSRVSRGDARIAQLTGLYDSIPAIRRAVIVVVGIATWWATSVIVDAAGDIRM